MARTRQADYVRSNRRRTIGLPDPGAAAAAAARLLQVHDAVSRRIVGVALVQHLCAQTGIAPPELVVPDEHQPHRRAGGRIVYSLQGDYRRREPSPGDPRVARGGRPLGRIRVLNRTPARGAAVRPSAFLTTLLHEFCHHHDAEALGLLRSFHTAGFYARLRHLKEQLGVTDAPAAAGSARRPAAAAGSAHRSPARALDDAVHAMPALARLWSIIRGRTA